MGIMCQVFLNPNPDGFYRPGDRVLGIVKYALDEETTLQDIELTFHGKGTCSWSETSGTGSSQTTTTYHGSEVIFKYNRSILLGGKLNHGEGSTVTLPVGAYEHPFEFRIREGVPPSHKDNIGKITYEVRVKFKRPGMFEFNREIYLEITVKSKASFLPPQEQEPINYAMEKTLLLSKKNRINVEAEIQRSCLLASQNAELKLVVKNYSKVTVPCVQAELIEKRIYTSNCGHSESYIKYIGECKAQTDSVAAQSGGRFTLTVPTAADMFTIHSSSVISKQYFVKVTLKLPLPYINASMEVPLDIANTEWPRVNERRNLPNTSTWVPPEIGGEWSGASGVILPSAPPAPASDPFTDAPPSYEEVMSGNIVKKK
ncbi:unnamed protein product [Plutella xylostella]|uniref:(diamondback moth) hypothetical protein n=1 Tax=Plutella xylostella TaxID=51655 RepID=A0A8S4DGC0_PLUXY|nr:unnamed protein product [Plutella xylostella]